jgi:transposase
MSQQRLHPEFEGEAVRKVVDRGHSVAEVSSRLGVSAHSLGKWVKAVKPSSEEQQSPDLHDAKSEILRLKAELRRTERRCPIGDRRPSPARVDQVVPNGQCGRVWRTAGILGSARSG